MATGRKIDYPSNLDKIAEALWDKQFADSQDVLDQLAESIHADYVAGLTEDFDPDTDPDLQ